MSHYFINDNRDKNEYDRQFIINDRAFSFKTSDCVFSKGGVDKGTGYLLEVVLPLIEDGDKVVVDLGCGYGVIGTVIAAMKPRIRCIMLDINEKAVALAELNAKNAEVDARTSALISDGTDALPVKVDYAVMNPPFRAGKQVVTRFFEESREALAGGGFLFAVLRKQQGAESYQKILAAIFGNCTAILKKKGYVVVMAQKLQLVPHSVSKQVNHKSESYE